MTRSLARKSWAMAALTLALATPMYVQAQGSYTALDRAQLPAYCKYTPGERHHGMDAGSNDLAEVKRWENLLAPVFYGMHHYCWGMMSANRALVARTRQIRAFELDRSIKEFDYVIRISPRNFVLLPEMLTKKGESLIRLGYIAGAGYITSGIQELQLAIEVKPDYWPPYAALSDHFKKVGDVAKAREWLEKALAVTPDVKSLTTRLAELEGTKGNKQKAAPEAVPEQARKRAKQPEPAEAIAEKPAPDSVQETAEPKTPGGG